MFKNSHFRLLMSLAGLQPLGQSFEETPESTWVIPGDVSTSALKDTLHYINQAEFSPPTFEEGVLAEDQLKRKTAPRKKVAYDDDEEGELDDGLFAAGGPTTRKVIDENGKPKNTRKRRRRDSQVEDLEDEELEERARKRRDREREKAERVKSALYVREGDDEFDEEEDEAFFAKEREIAALAAQASNAARTALAISNGLHAPKKKPTTAVISADEEDEDDDDEDSSEDGVEDDDDDDDMAFLRKTLGSTAAVDDKPSNNPGRKRRRLSVTSGDDVDMTGTEKEVEEDEDIAPVAPRRPRVRGGFVVDSDDDE